MEEENFVAKDCLLCIPIFRIYRYRGTETLEFIEKTEENSTEWEANELNCVEFRAVVTRSGSGRSPWYRYAVVVTGKNYS